MFSLEQYQAIHERAGLSDRSARGRLRLTGADRRDYLQGLLTNDIAALTAGGGCYACLLTAQGRMISDMYVVETGDAILLDLEADVTAKVVAHLEQFIFAEDVQVSDVSDSLAQVGLLGAGAADAVSRTLGDAAEPGRGQSPGELNALEPLQNRTWTWRGAPLILVRRDDVGVLGFDLVIDAARREELAQALRANGAVAIDPDVVEVRRIEAGRPVFHKDMSEDTIPLEAGIEDRAISVTKGCYVGQEIIIRVLHRGGGRVARRLVGLSFDPTAQVPAHGDRIQSGDRDIGWITSAVRSEALQRPIALGYVHRDFVGPGTMVGVAGGQAKVTRLPFV